MKASAGGPYSRVAMAIIAAAVVVAVAIIASPIIGTPKIVTTTDNLTSTASLTITDVIVSNRTITVSVTEDRPYALVINPGTIVSGQAVSIPGCAVHGGCASTANQSSSAMLILYKGSYYYVSNYTFTGQHNVVYTVWYTNSTEFCVSPAVSWDPLCPNAVFIPENSVQTKTIQSMSCPVSGEGGPLLVRIVTNQGVPVQNQQVQVVHRGPTVNEQYCGTVSLPALITNSSGWVKVPGGDGLPYAGSFAVSFVYSAQSYDGLVTIEPLATTYVTFYVPSGQEATMYCPLDNCPTYSDSMTMGG